MYLSLYLDRQTRAQTVGLDAAQNTCICVHRSLDDTFLFLTKILVFFSISL